MVKIYLVENIEGDPMKVYIGKTKNSRKNDHRKTYGNDIIYTVIDEVESLLYRDWEPLESFWIEQFIQWNFKVVNIRRKGGSGPNFHTDETKLLMSGLSKGKNIWRKGKPSPNSGARGKPKPTSGCRNWTEAHRVRIVEAAKTKNKSFYRDKEWLKSQQKIIKQYTLDNELLKYWDSIKEASEILKINRVSITHCLRGSQKSAGKFKWKYG